MYVTGVGKEKHGGAGSVIASPAGEVRQSLGVQIRDSWKLPPMPGDDEECEHSSDESKA